MGHTTDECRARLRTFTCRNCKGHHASFDRECPKFIEKCAQLDMKCPENALAYYPTDEPWSWATSTLIQVHEPHLGERQDLPHQTNRPEFRTGANNVPIGHTHPPEPQSNQDTSQ